VNCFGNIFSAMLLTKSWKYSSTNPQELPKELNREILNSKGNDSVCCLTAPA